MFFCKGRTEDGKKCNKKIQGDKFCLAHKLKTLPREILTIIFEKIESIEELYYYTQIYSEAIPAYLNRTLEIGKSIANEMLVLNGIQPLVTDDRKVIYKTVWKMLFATVKSRIAGSENLQYPELRSIYYRQTQLFTDAVQYCKFQFQQNTKNFLENLTNEQCLKYSILQGEMSSSLKTYIHNILLLCPHFRRDYQMTALANILFQAYQLLNFTSSDGKILILYRILTQISEIEVDGKRLIYLPAIDKILN